MTEKYNYNKTMRMIGQQTHLEYLNMSEIGDIITANMEFGKDIFDTCLDGFSLGFIYGVRSERAKRKPKSINDKISDHLRKNNIDTDVLAKKSDLSEDTIFDICYEEKEISALEYYKICKALDLSLDHFFSNDSVKAPSEDREKAPWE